MLQEKARTAIPTTKVQPAAATLPGTILVHIATQGNAESLELALKLAEPSRGAVCAVVAEGFEPEYAPGALMQALFTARLRRMAAAKANAETLRDAATAPVMFFAEEAFPEEAVAMHACGADWIAVVRPEHAGAHAIHADASALLLRTGAPVLIAPRGAPPLSARRVVVAWRDSREARRAISAALPLLEAADDVLVMAVCPEEQADAATTSLEQVVARLSRRNCHARCELHQTDGRHDVASMLDERAKAIGADLIVSGAYAHSRAGEWVFGGVTRSLIEGCSRYLLMIH